MATAQQQATALRGAVATPNGRGAELLRQMQARGIQAPQQAAEDDDDDVAIFAGAGTPSKLTNVGSAMFPRFSVTGGAGDKIRKASEYKNDFYNMSRNDILKLQDRLERGGFLERGSYQKGVHDGTTLKAYSVAVARAGDYFAAGKKMTVDDVIAEGASNPLEVEKDPFNPKVTNPEDLKTVIGKAAGMVIGHNLDQKTIDQLVAQYQNLEIGEQRSEYDLKVNRQDGTITTAPDANAWAAQQVRAKDPMGAAQLDVLDGLSEVTNMINNGFDSTSLGRGRQ